MALGHQRPEGQHQDHERDRHQHQLEPLAVGCADVANVEVERRAAGDEERIGRPVGNVIQHPLHLGAEWLDQIADAVAAGLERDQEKGRALVGGEEGRVRLGQMRYDGLDIGQTRGGFGQRIERVASRPRLERTGAFEGDGKELTERAGKPLGEHPVGDPGLGRLLAAASKRQAFGRLGGLGEGKRAQDDPDGDDEGSPSHQGSSQGRQDHQRSICSYDN